MHSSTTNCSEKDRYNGSRLEWKPLLRTATGLVKLSALAFAAILLFTATKSAHAQTTESVLHTFAGSPDGAYPLAGLALDTATAMPSNSIDLPL